MGKVSEFWPVGDVSARSGVPVSTLHFYERKGLIESFRTSGNQRRYPRAILRRLAVIRIAQEAGVPLSEIAERLRVLDGELISRAQWQRLSAEWHDQLNERIEKLTALRDKLDGCIGCGCLSTQACPLRNPDDRLGREGKGAVLLRP